MNLNQVNELADGLDDKSKSAVLKLIDLKTEDDMEKILAKIDARFEHVEGSIAAMRWTILVAGAVLTALLTIIALK